MTGIGYLATFLGGVLTLLSPCSGLLLPAFFAYAFAGRARLLASTSVFYLGLAGVLVPLGMGSSAASTLVYGHQAALTNTAGVLLICFGVVQFAGAGFTIPGLGGLAARLRGRSLFSALALGAVSGLAGFCAGPILGAVLTVAAASAQPVHGAALLAVYAAGMTAPLFGLAAVWDRLRIGQRRWLRGKGVKAGPFHLHTHSVIAGLLFTGLGVVFLRYQGTAGLSGLLSPPSLSEWDNRLQDAVTTVQAHVPDLALLAAMAVAVLAVTVWRLRHARLAAPAPAALPAGPALPARPALPAPPAGPNDPEPSAVPAAETPRTVPPAQQPPADGPGPGPAAIPAPGRGLLP